MTNALETIVMNSIPEDGIYEITDRDSEVYCCTMQPDDFYDFFGTREGCVEELGRETVGKYIAEFSRLTDMKVGEIIWDFNGNWIVKRLV